MSDEDDDFKDMPLFARHSDPITSHKAMRAFNRSKRLGRAVDIAVKVFQAHPGGLTDVEFAPLFRLAYAAPSCAHLYRQARSSARDRGLIRDTGVMRRNPASRREQIVWEACNVAPPTIVKCEACGRVLERVEGAKGVSSH